jgi:hypothetical protein
MDGHSHIPVDLHNLIDGTVLASLHTIAPRALAVLVAKFQS